MIELGEWLEANSCTQVGMEATGVYWKPVWQVLSDGSFTLVLANAAQVKNVPGRKTDVNDATWLAELLAHGLVRASFVPEAPIQELRGLLLTRNYHRAASDRRARSAPAPLASPLHGQSRHHCR